LLCSQSLAHVREHTLVQQQNDSLCSLHQVLDRAYVKTVTHITLNCTASHARSTASVATVKSVPLIWMPVS